MIILILYIRYILGFQKSFQFMFAYIILLLRIDITVTEIYSRLHTITKHTFYDG